MNEYLSEKSDKSSMRLNVLLLNIACVFIFITIGVYVLAGAFGKTQIDWQGMGYFVGGMAFVVTGSNGVKAYQKKHEASRTPDLQQKN